MQHRKIFESFNVAIEGFIYVMKSQRNMRIHFLLAVLIVLVGMLLSFTKTELLVLCITITIVLVAEMTNTTLELLVDIVKSEFHPLAKIIKDIAAGTVLVASINAVIVGYMLFYTRIPFNVDEGLSRVRQSSWHVTFIALIVVLSLVIAGKTFSRKGRPLQGGMPSGHAAVAFAAWTVIVFMTTNMLVITLTFLMAFLIAKHRVRDRIHSVWEVFVGSMIGILFTTLVFQFLR